VGGGGRDFGVIPVLAWMAGMTSLRDFIKNHQPHILLKKNNISSWASPDRDKLLMIFDGMDSEMPKSLIYRSIRPSKNCRKSNGASPIAPVSRPASP